MYIRADSFVHESSASIWQIRLSDTDHRDLGVGKLLIHSLVAEMKLQGWSRVYWHRRENNYRARTLYDKFTPHGRIPSIENSSAR